MAGMWTYTVTVRRADEWVATLYSYAAERATAAAECATRAARAANLNVAELRVTTEAAVM